MIPDADTIRGTERDRLRALVEGDLPQVRTYADAALVRYQARITIEVRGRSETASCWHTDCYEYRDGRWQAVWSQATEIG